MESNANSIVLGYPEQRTMINGGVDGGAGSVNYYLDGGNNMTGLRNTGNIAPNPDAVEEFRVITNSYSAEFGRFASGVINIITKSGTQPVSRIAVRVPSQQRPECLYLGLSFSPRLRCIATSSAARSAAPSVKNKTFFFGTYSGLRQITSNFFNGAIVPTALERGRRFLAIQDRAHGSHEQRRIRSRTI